MRSKLEMTESMKWYEAQNNTITEVKKKKKRKYRIGIL